MRLLELELSGFKSFADKTVFRFDDGITAIIGANGTGKSNVSDAIRWVLGEQSLKHLRGKGSEDIIFAGSDGKHKGQARVSLTLSNESGRLRMDAAEVRITRQLNRSGEGEYRINEDNVRLWDIQQILAEAGLGTKSYAVISQGTVDRYLNAGPTARRELFDEACGIKALQLKLKKADRTFTQAEQKVRELSTILQEMEPRLRVLKRQALRFQQRHELEEEYRVAQEDWYTAGWLERSSYLSKLRADSSDTYDQLDRARKRREEIEASLFRVLEQNSEREKDTEINDAGHRLPGVAEVRDAISQCNEILQAILSGEEQEDSELRDAEKKTRGLLNRINAVLSYKQSAKQQGRHEDASEKDSIRKELQSARDTELAAERESSAASAVAKHAGEELEEWEREIQRELGSDFLSQLPSRPAPADEEEELENKTRRLEAKLASIGEIDPLTVKEYEETRIRWEHLNSQLQDVLQAKDDTRRQIDLLKKEMLLRFRSNFNEINNRFKENFRLLFGGGKAQIELTYEEESDVQEDEDRDNSFTGIDIAVAPPGKNPRHIGLLSGGEKALTSLALLLSIIQVQRPPFLVLDEVDAALDEVNSFRFAEALEKMAEFTQCIVITHNRETMGKADVLYGVAMGTNGASDIYSVKMEDVAC